MSKITKKAHRPGWYPLIGQQDPPPALILNEAGTAQTLLVADHAGRAIPQAMLQLGLPAWVLDQHVAWDIGVYDLTVGLAVHLDAPAVVAVYSRLLIDCNRNLTDPTVIPEISDEVVIPGNQHLSEQDREQRIESFYQPYREAIEQVIDGYRQQGKVPALVAVHSFTPELAGVHRPWHVGILWDVDPRIAIPLMGKLRTHSGLEVGDNQPYSGRHPADFTLDHHGEAAGLPHVSIEVRQDLIDHPEGIERWTQILGDALEEILAEPQIYSLWPG